jgi:hypothetical protein
MPQLVDIFDVHQLVETPIHKIGEEAGKPSLFADIYKACSQGEAFLFVEGESFTVLKPIVEDRLSKLLVWVAYSKVGNAYEKFMPFIEERARDIEVDVIEFWTALEPMNRYVRSKGWTKKYTIWSKKCSMN